MRAKQLGYRGLAICDVNGLYGVVRGFQAAERPSAFDAEQMALSNPDGSSKVPFHYMCGAELTPYDASPVALLPMNKEGYVRLCHLITGAKRRAPKGHIVVSLKHILAENEDLIVFPLPPWKDEHLKQLADAFQDRIYLPVYKDFTWESVRLYQQALKIEQSLGILPFATQRPLFHAPDRKPLHDVLTCILHKTTLQEAATRLSLNRERYLKPVEEILHLFRERPDLVARTGEIAARVGFSLTELRYRYPRENLPLGKSASEFLRDLVEEGLAWRYPAWTPPEFMNKVRRQAAYELELITEMEYEDYFLTLWDICQYARKQGILHQGRGSAANSIVCFALGLTSVDPVRLGLLFERFISRERGEPPDIDIDFEHERREEVIQYIYRKYGERRAAMVCTVICYRSRMAVRETAKAFGVPIERIDSLIKFMGREGLSRLVQIAAETTAPLANDLVADLAPESFVEVMDEKGEGYDEDDDRALAIQRAKASGVRPPKLSHQDVARAPGVAESRSVPYANETVDLAKFGLNEEIFRKLLQLSLELQGFPRHIGIHSGGFVISHEAVIDIVPVEAATMEGRYVIQWNKDDIAILGLMKIDVLALGMLTAVKKCLDLLRSHKGVDWDLSQIPQRDPGTYAMIQKADTVGVFQIESRAQMSLLPRLKPKTFYDLVIEVAIVRPGPIQGGMVHPYLRRRSGQERVRYAHPALEPILKKTLGIPLFQEQIMQIAVAVAGFTPGEADELRRVVSSAWKKKSVMLGLRQRVISGMLSNGLSREYADQIYQTIEGFSSYGFPESHAASFALITYASCYLKHHHPDVFACSLLNSQPMGFYAPRQLIADAQRHGVIFLPLDVQCSDWDHTLEEPPKVSIMKRNSAGLAMRALPGAAAPSKEEAEPIAGTGGGSGIRATKRWAVRTGYRSIYGIREEHARALVESRKAHGPYRDLTDLVRRSGVPRATLIRLAAAGALESFGLPARKALWALQAMNFDEQSLFFGANVSLDGERLDHESSLLPEENPWETVRREYKTKGFSLDSHPMAVVRPQLLKASSPYVTAAQLLTLKDRAPVRVAGLMGLMQKPPTAKGICFISLEDETGLCNVIIMPDLYMQCRLLLQTAPLLEVYGKLESREGVRNVKAISVRALAEMAESRPMADG